MTDRQPGPFALRTLVTNEGVCRLYNGDVVASGARFRANGEPANLEAWLLLDFCAMDLRGELN
jgi:hypothetical protein